MPAAIARRQRFAVNAADWSLSQGDLHRATRCGSPRHTLQVWWKERPIRETVLIQGTDQVLPSFLLFFSVSFIKPRLEERREFRVTILGRQGLVQQLQG